MLRRFLVMTALAVVGLLGPAAAAGADTSSVEVPAAVGIMGAADPGEDTSASPVAPVTAAVGVALLLGGGITAARSWVSTKPAG